MTFTVKCEHGLERTVEIEDGREHPSHPDLIRKQLAAIVLGCPMCAYQWRPEISYVPGTTERA